MEASKPRDQTAQNAVKLVGEAFLPGASLLLEGKIVEGGAHLLAGVAARALLGPLGLAVVMANSYAKATTGKNLLKQFTQDSPRDDRNKAEHITKTEHKVEHKTTAS